jgi:CDP-glucose 4,6-dehydratase
MLDIYRNKKVFITGDTGFKGSWLSCLLKSLGAHVAGFSLDPITEPSHFHLLKNYASTTIGNISNVALLKKSVEEFQPDIILHLAAQPLVIESYKDPHYTYETNVLGTLNILESVRECKSVKAVVIITTDKVYENKEWCYPYRENDQLGGYDIYSSSKACAELLVKSYERSFFNKKKYGVEHHVLIATARAGNVIGGGDWSKNRLIPDIVKAASGGNIVQIRNPNAVRPWQHVLDCLYGYLLLGEKLLVGDAEFADSWNFAPHSHESRTVHEVANIAAIIWDDIKVKVEEQTEQFHEAGILRLDNSKSISALKWRPIWNTEESIRCTIEWYKSFYLNNIIRTESDIKTFMKAI